MPLYVPKAPTFQAEQWNGSNAEAIKGILSLYWTVEFEDTVLEDGQLHLSYDGGAVNVFIPANAWVVAGPIWGGRADLSITLTPEEFEAKYEPVP